MGLKRHSAKGRGQRPKNFYTMHYALCVLLILIPYARQYSTASKTFSNFPALAGYKFRYIKLLGWSGSNPAMKGGENQFKEVLLIGAGLLLRR